MKQLELHFSRLFFVCSILAAPACAPASEVDDQQGISPVGAGTSDAGGDAGPFSQYDAAPSPTVDAGLLLNSDAGQLDAQVSRDAGNLLLDGSTSADGSTSNDSGTDAGQTVEPADRGKGNGSDVITIGDSWMEYFLNGGGIQRALKASSGQPYRTYAVAGTKLLDEVIPKQYASAKKENPKIETIVMTGGGNDLLLTGSGNDCSTAGPNCKAQIDKVGARLVQLWAQMGTDGVKDIVYIEYSRGGTNEASVTYGAQKIRPLCAAVAPARCHWVDSDEIINRALLVDGIHPTQASCDKLGAAVFKLMQTEGMRR